MFEAGNRGLQVLHNNLSTLNLVAKVAPLLGLLGTVLGMIEAFQSLQSAGSSVDPALLAAIIANVAVNMHYKHLSDLFPFIGVAVWLAILLCAPLRTCDPITVEFLCSPS